MRWLLVLALLLAACDSKSVIVGDCYNFVPQPDITAYEVALVVSHLRGPRSEVIAFKPGAFEALPPGLQRHFRKVSCL